MKKVWITAAAVMVIASVAVAYLRNKKSKETIEEDGTARRAAMSKHRTQVFSKAKEMVQAKSMN